MRGNGVMGMVVVAVVLAAGVAWAQATGPETAVPRDDAYRQAREQLADLLASEDFDKVEVAASSFDRAMELIYRAVETYLDRAVPALGSIETAREYGVEVLGGLQDHTIHYADDDGYDLAGERRLLISSESDAADLGELLARTAIMIHAAHPGHGVEIRTAARRIFDGMLPVQGTGQPLVSQYLVRLRTLTRSGQRELMRYALE